MNGTCLLINRHRHLCHQDSCLRETSGVTEKDLQTLLTSVIDHLFLQVVHLSFPCEDSDLHLLLGQVLVAAATAVAAAVKIDEKEVPYLKDPEDKKLLALFSTIFAFLFQCQLLDLFSSEDIFYLDCPNDSQVFFCGSDLMK